MTSRSPLRCLARLFKKLNSKFKDGLSLKTASIALDEGWLSKCSFRLVSTKLLSSLGLNKLVLGLSNKSRDKKNSLDIRSKGLSYYVEFYDVYL